MILGEAIQYVGRIGQAFEDAGYTTTLTLCNGTYMGLPQKRERTFFVAIRHDLIQYIPQQGLFNEPYIDLSFNEEPILWREVKTSANDRPLTEQKYNLWKLRKEGDIDLSSCCARNGENPNKFFNCKFIYTDKVPNTVAGKDYCIVFDDGRFRNHEEIKLCSSFPLDYNFQDQPIDYICGMSVPPVMMAQVASRVYEQWLNNINKNK